MASCKNCFHSCVCFDSDATTKYYGKETAANNVEQLCCNYIPKESVRTNADRIRTMSNEELATLLLDGCRGAKCDEQPQNEHGSVNCYVCRMRWLQLPAADSADVRKALEWLQGYTMTDTKQVYSNGCVYVPLYRVEQALLDKAYNGLQEG